MILFKVLNARPIEATGPEKAPVLGYGWLGSFDYSLHHPFNVLPLLSPQQVRLICRILVVSIFDCRIRFPLILFRNCWEYVYHYPYPIRTEDYEIMKTRKDLFPSFQPEVYRFLNTKPSPEKCVSNFHEGIRPRIEY